MTMPELTTEETRFREELQKALVEAKAKVRSRENAVEIINKLGALAHDLHESLAARGYEPHHHRYMLENRGVAPSSPQFYRHIHPVEDLIKFTYDPRANDDPEDVTIGQEFLFKVFSRRWGHEDAYRVKRTTTGWHISHISIGGSCDKSGRPFLFENLRHDSIDYPSTLGDRMEWLWEKTQDLGLSAEAVQQELNKLADWVSKTEKSSPNDGIWAGY
jgi:integron cassette protein